MLKKSKSVVGILKHAVSVLITLVFKRKNDEGENKQISNNSSFSLSHMSWKEYEEYIFDIFNQRGYSLDETRELGDGGVDLLLTMNNETTLVHCKKWDKQKVDVPILRDFYSLMADEGAQHGIVIISGEFTQDAIDYSLGKYMLLFNGADLLQMIQALKPVKKPDVNTSVTVESKINSIPTKKKNKLSTTPEKKQKAVDEIEREEKNKLEPLCPLCNSVMLKRVARKGKNAGSVFWGCSQFPDCRGVVSINTE